MIRLQKFISKMKKAEDYNDLKDLITEYCAHVLDFTNLMTLLTKHLAPSSNSMILSQEYPLGKVCLK